VETKARKNKVAETEERREKGERRE